MPTLIRTLKKITTPPTKPSKSSPVAVASTQNDLIPLVHHDIQLRKTEATATTDAAEMNRKPSSNPSDNATSPQKAPAADISYSTPASLSSEKRNAHDDIDRKRKSSSVDEELAREKRARSRKRKLCSAERCTNIAIKGGVCIRHGAKVKRCSNEGCRKYAQRGGVCMKHGARVKLCSADGCVHQAKQGGVCISHGAKVKRCSIEGCINQAKKKGGVCKRHGAEGKLCSNEGCTNRAQQGEVCIRHGAEVKRYSYDGTFQDHRPTHPLPPTNFTSVPPLVVYPKNQMMPPPNHNYHGYPPPVHHGNCHFIRPALPYPYPVSRMPIHYAPILLSKALPSDKIMASVDNLDDTAANK